MDADICSVGTQRQEGAWRDCPAPLLLPCEQPAALLSERRPSDSASGSGCGRCCQDGGLRDPSQVTWGTSSCSIHPPCSLSPPVWDGKSTEQSVSSVLPGSSGPGTASVSPGCEKGGHKHSSSVTISSTALQQWCIEQPAEDNGFEILLPPPHPTERFSGGKKKGKKIKDEKEALGPLETSAPSQCCSAQAKHLSLNGAQIPPGSSLFQQFCQITPFLEGLMESGRNWG